MMLINVWQKNKYKIKSETFEPMALEKKGTGEILKVNKANTKRFDEYLISHAKNI